MNCPHCNHTESRVLETRASPHGTRRRHRCRACKLTFASYNNRVTVKSGSAFTSVAAAMARAIMDG